MGMKIRNRDTEEERYWVLYVDPGRQYGDEWDLSAWSMKKTQEDAVASATRCQHQCIVVKVIGCTPPRNPPVNFDFY
jgi:hypothetical protein